MKRPDEIARCMKYGEDCYGLVTDLVHNQVW